MRARIVCMRGWPIMTEPVLSLIRRLPARLHSAGLCLYRWMRKLLDRELFSVAIEYMALVVLATYPAVLRLRSAIIGDSYSDMWKHLWGLWWFYDALVDHHQLPIFTTHIDYPQGGYLYFADPLTASVSVVLQPLFGLVCTYNLLILAQLIGGCLGGFLLAREVGLRRSGSFLAGMMYGLSPYVLSYSAGSGVTETINLAWPALYLCYLLRTLRGEGRQASLRAAVCLFLTAFACWYYAEFMLLMTALIFLFGSTAPPLGRHAWPRYRGMLMERGRFLVPVLVVSFCLILPFATTFAEVIRNPYNLVTPDKGGGAHQPMRRDPKTFHDYLGENQLNYIGLYDILRPGKENATVTVSMDRLTRVYYVGWIALALIVTGLLLAPRPWSRELHFWLWSTVVFWFLSLGPQIHLRSDMGDVGHAICRSWPYMLVYYTFPLFKQIAQPFRMMLLVYLGAGLLAGFGLERLQARMAPSMKGWIWLIALGILLETLYVSPTPYPIPLASATIDPVYYVLAGIPGHGGVWDVPDERPGGILVPSEYYYYQTVHHRPIPYRTSGEVSRQIRDNGIHRVLRNLHSGCWETQSSTAMLHSGVDELRQMRMRYLILHRNLLGVGATALLAHGLEKELGPPTYEDDRLVLFRVY